MKSFVEEGPNIQQGGIKMATIFQLFGKLMEGPLGTIVGIGTIIGWIIGIYWFVRTGIRYRRRKKFLEFTPSSEGTIAVSIGIGISPEKAVKEFLKKNFSNVPLIMSYSKEGHFSENELLKIFEEIKSNFKDLMKKGDISEILLFYGGPVTVMALIGAVLDNWVPVRLFAYNGKYRFHFTLNKELVKTVPPKFKEK